VSEIADGSRVFAGDDAPTRDGTPASLETSQDRRVTPGKGQDKIARVNAVSDLFAGGVVWAPEHRWAREVIEECNDFPSGANDDLVDSTTLALLRFRQGGFIRLPSDEEDEDFLFKYGRKKAAYY
jgi:hypothetical protein